MKQKDLLFLLISSALLAGVWIIFTILHSSLTSSISTTLNQQIIQIDRSFDIKTIQSLQNRQGVTPQNVLQGTDNITNTPTPTLVQIAPLTPISGSSSATTATPTQGGSPKP